MNRPMQILKEMKFEIRNNQRFHAYYSLGAYSNYRPQSFIKLKKLLDKHFEVINS